MNIINVYIRDMKLDEKRNYSMEKRSASAQKTEAKILQGLYLTWLDNSLRDITLEKVAEQSGVTVRTILRKFGSKEGLFEASLKMEVNEIKQIKDSAKEGDLVSIVDALMVEYEKTGIAGIRTLSLEYEMEQAAQILAIARQFHRSWCERVFAPFLDKADAQKRHEMIGALYVETDINCWKILRLDLAYSIEETKAIMHKKIIGTLHAYSHDL